MMPLFGTTLHKAVPQEDHSSVLTQPLLSAPVPPNLEAMRERNAHLFRDDGETVQFTDEALATMYDAFLRHDADGDGSISKEELKSVLRAAHVHITREKEEEMLRLADKNGNGRLGFSEFCDLTAHLIQDIDNEAPGITMDGSSSFQLQDLGDLKEKDTAKIVMCLVTLAAYLLTGVCYGSIRRGWTVLDSIYFCVSTMTTVGYGEFNFIGPDMHDAELQPDWVDRVFGGFFVFVGVGCVGSAICTLMEYLEARAQARMEVIKLQWQLDNANDTAMMDAFDFEAEKRKLYIRFLLSFVAIASTLAIGTCVMSMLEEWDVSAAFYWACVSMTTVGYGDMVPTTEATKIFTIAYILASFSLVVTAISLVSSFPYELKRLTQVHQVMTQFGEDLDRNELHALLGCEELLALRTDEMSKAREKEGGAGVTRAEFTLWLLMKQEKISLRDDVKTCLKVFDKLDPDRSGELNEEDIRECITRANAADK